MDIFALINRIFSTNAGTAGIRDYPKRVGYIPRSWYIKK